jgi:hypothetical protein
MSTIKILLIIILSFVMLSSSVAIGYAFYVMKNQAMFALDNSIKVTRPNENGTAVFLDRHNVDCGVNALNQFKLEKNKDSIFYNYKCSKSDKLESPQQIINPKTELNASIIYLNRQNIKCGQDEVINNFKLNNALHNEWYYTYNCSKSKVPLTCRSVESESTQIAPIASAVSPLHVKCEPDEVLSQFKLHNPGNNNQMAYKYTCCK